MDDATGGTRAARAAGRTGAAARAAGTETAGGAGRDGEVTVPEGGFWPAPQIPRPNIYPKEWRVETERPAEIYEKSKRTVWNPADLPWDGLRPEDFTPEQRPGGRGRRRPRGHHRGVPAPRPRGSMLLLTDF